MEPFAGVVPFVAVAEERSFRAAAARLGLSVAAVSKAVQKLEARLGATLLARTSRQVALTAEGALYLARCRAALDELQAGRELVAEAGKVAQGPLRISLSPIVARPVATRLGSLAARHPRLAFELVVTDRLTRLAEEGIDVAVRIGELDDSSLVGKLLARPRWALVASPGYLARAGAPRKVAELEAHDRLLFRTQRGVPRPWSLRGRAAPDGPARLVTDSGEALLDAALAGLGVAQVFDFMAEPHLEAGRLVELLPEEGTEGPPIRALTLPRRKGSPKVKVAIEFLERVFRG